jgi:hypothetical protein
MTADRRLLYVYALIERRVASPRLPGRRRLEIIEVGPIFAAVERVVDAPTLSEQALREQHQVVVRLARVAKAILPVRFGAVIERDELERIVQTREAVLRQALGDVRGKAQMTVRVFGPAQQASPSMPPASGAAYLRARAEMNQPRLPAIARAIVSAVRPLVSAETIDAGRGNVRVTINHLIDRKMASRYLTAIEPFVQPRVSGREPRAGSHGSAIDSVVAASGPWPPFAFAPDLLSPAMPLERLVP